MIATSRQAHLARGARSRLEVLQAIGVLTDSRRSDGLMATTIREIARFLDRPYSVIYYELGQLRAAGRIIFEGTITRTIRLAPPIEPDRAAWPLPGEIAACYQYRGRWFFDLRRVGMTARYAIADWLTEAQIDAALAHEYGPIRDVQSYCPLGRALNLVDHPAPPSSEVADVLLGYRVVDAQWEAVSIAARDFINDWDAGRIPPADLAAALGRKP